MVATQWKTTLMSRYRLNFERPADVHGRVNLMTEITTTTTRAHNALLNMQIDAPGGRRAISDEEAEEITVFINASAQTIIEQAKVYKERRKNAA